MTAWKCKGPPDAEGFFALGPADEILEEQITSATANGQALLLTRIGQEIHAVSAFCPHAAADLRQGAIYRGRIDCPDHGYRFDVRSGRILWPEDEVYRLKRFEVRIQSGLVKVRLSSR